MSIIGITAAQYAETLRETIESIRNDYREDPWYEPWTWLLSFHILRISQHNKMRLTLSPQRSLERQAVLGDDSMFNVINNATINYAVLSDVNLALILSTADSISTSNSYSRIVDEQRIPDFIVWGQRLLLASKQKFSKRFIPLIVEVKRDLAERVGLVTQDFTALDEEEIEKYDALISAMMPQVVTQVQFAKQLCPDQHVFHVLCVVGPCWQLHTFDSDKVPALPKYQLNDHDNHSYTSVASTISSDATEAITSTTTDSNQDSNYSSVQTWSKRGSVWHMADRRGMRAMDEVWDAILTTEWM